MKKSFVLFILLFSFLPAISKDFNAESFINRTDSLGLKNGLWIDGYTGWMSFYKNGVPDGPSICLEPKKDGIYIALIETLNKATNYGSRVAFYPNGVVSSILTRMLPNTDFKGWQIMYDKDFNFKYQSYCMEFYPSGKLQAEGWYILGEEIEIDFERVCVWKFYGEDGTVEEVNFSDPKVDTKYSR